MEEMAIIKLRITVHKWDNLKPIMFRFQNNRKKQLKN
jgi:hypothetical protein